MIRNSKKLFGHIYILFVCIQLIQCDVTSGKTDEWTVIQKLKSYVNNVLTKKEENFYDYSIVCGRDVDSFARVDKSRSFIDGSIPIKYRDRVLKTYVEDSQRQIKCPRWSPNVDSTPKSGSMGNIKIQENVKPGDIVYILSALSDSPLYYLMRNAEDETDMMFDVITERTTNGYIGRVVLKEPLDYETKKLYKYIVYAFDGTNLIERLSSIEVIDVDDEPPKIDTNHPNYNKAKNRFEFEVLEDASIDHVLNLNKPIRFTDVDTQPSQLKINLVNNFTGSDVPFSLSVAGKLSLTGSIDFESQADYLLRITVKDGSNSMADELIYVKLIDVPDLSPLFVLPSFNTSSKFKQRAKEVKFYENQIGTVFDIRAVSRNKDPLGPIEYSIVSVSPSEMRDKFRLNKYEQNETYFLNCIEKIEHKPDGKEQIVKIVIKASESAVDSDKTTYFQRQLTTENTINIRVISGDMCKPTFDKELYEFEVVENETPLLGGEDTIPIIVEDCDYDVNGRIILTSTNKNFHLINNYAYRKAIIGFELKKPLDYDNLEPNDIEFSIIARGSNHSINRYETSTRVRIRVLNLNEFAPQFVLPEPKLGDKVGVFSYSAPENQDFQIKVKAVDSDKGADGQIIYGIDMINDDKLIVNATHYSENDLYEIIVPGAFLDSNTRSPISFIVRAHDNGRPEKTSHIVITIKAYPSFFRPPYFEFQGYGFMLNESELSTTELKLKILDDNLSKSTLEIIETNDPLNLFSFELEDLMPKNFIPSNFQDIDDEQINTEKILSLTLTNKSLDLDEFYALNNQSDLYVYKVRVGIQNQTKLFTESEVRVQLIDDNDNEPVILNMSGEFVEATLDSNFKPNTPIEMKQNIRFDDLDFSPEYGIDSLYLRINDTRFMIDQEAILDELDKFKNLNLSPRAGIPLVVRCLVTSDQLEPNEIIWLNVTCEDNYIYSRFNNKKIMSKFVLIKLSVTKSLLDIKLANLPVFEKKFYEYTIDENWSGKLDKIKILNDDLRVKYELLTQNDRFELLNENDLVLTKPLDYDNGERVFNITIRVENQKDKSLFSTTYVLVIVNDLNDNTPSFLENEFKFAMIRENVISKDTKIGSLYAVDLDNNDELQFSLKSSNELNDEKLFELFDLVPIETVNNRMKIGSGLQGVNLIAKIDFNLAQLSLKSDTLSFKALVSDKANHKQTSNILIKFVSSLEKKQQIEWLNLNNKTMYRATIKENSENGTFVAEVRAAVKTEKPDDQVVRYQLIGEPNQYYRINETTGRIYTTGKKMSRKSTSAQERQKSNILLVQASYSRPKRNTNEEDQTVWSQIVTVQIDLEDVTDSAPIFVQPSNNKTKLIVTHEILRQGSIYQFKAIDPDMNDEITFKALNQERVDLGLQVDQKNKLFKQLPFKVDRLNGSLEFDSTGLSSQDYLKILEEIDDNHLIVRLQVEAIDQRTQSTSCYLYIQFDFKTFYNLYKKSVSDLAMIELRLQAKSPYLKEIQSSHEIARSQLESQKAYYFSLNQTVAPNTVIAQLKPYLNNTGLKLLPETLRIISESSAAPIFKPELFKPIPIRPNQVVPGLQPPSLDNIDPATYFSYDPTNGTIKLIRRINNELIRNISFYLTDPLTQNEWSKLSNEINSQKINVNIFVNTNTITSGRSIKKLGLELHEKIGESNNLILIDVFNLTSQLPSDNDETQIEMLRNQAKSLWNKERADFAATRVHIYDSMIQFSNNNILDSFKIKDDVDTSNLTVQFGKMTDQQVIDSFELVNNKTHVLFRRTRELNQDNNPFKDVNSDKLFFKFSIELIAPNENVTYFGNLYIIDAKQIQRILHISQDFSNSIFTGKLHRSKIVQTRINLEPMIRLSNPLPIELKLKLLDKEFNQNKNILQAKYFSTYPIQLESWIDSGLFEKPTEIQLVLQQSLEDDDFTAEWNKISLNLRLFTSNSYINKLLEALDTQIQLLVGMDNLHAPLISEIQPGDLIIPLREGKYDKKEIARIKAIDKDTGDSGRLEYYLIGSNLLDINRQTGVVFLTGELDAETEQEIKFYCYSRDLAPEPLTKQSETIEFIIRIKDMDEFRPIITSPIGPFNLKENEPPNLVDSILIECFDRDITSNVNLYLTSIRYVLAHDTNVFVEDTNAQDEDRIELKDLFRLVYFIDEESAFAPNQTKQASLKLMREIDYEKLYRPQETLIRIDLMCTDATSNLNKESRILIKIEDENDNKPVFINKTGSTIKIDESSKFESILKVNAYDLDLSPAYGNESLVYSISQCEPDPFKFFMDKRSGEVYSELIVNADNEDLISKRRELYVKNSSLFNTSPIDIRCRFKVADSYGKPVGFLRNNSDASKKQVLSEEMDLTIQIENLNDNAPIIRTKTLPDNTIEVKEGESTRGQILTQIAVLDLDDASGLKCVFENRLTFWDPFELRTSLDKHDPFMTWCILKVRDDMFIDYDAVKISSYLLELLVLDEEKTPVYPNSGLSRAQIKVRVIPVNNRPPMFASGQEQTVYTLDTFRPGTVIATVLATDFENPNPDRIFYELDNTMTPAVNKFELVYKNTTNLYWGSVNLVIKEKLDVNESPYIVSVTAYDGPIGMRDTLKSRKIIKVYVLNKGTVKVWVNRDTGQPVDYYPVIIDEELPSNTQVVRVQAIIPNIFKEDTDQNDLIYSIDSFNNNTNMTRNPYYKIDPVTGEITTTSIRLDYEEKDSIKRQLMRNIQVRATTQDGLFEYQTYVSVLLQDINDNQPKFDYSIVSKLNQSLFCVVENRTSLEQIGVVHATDLDSGLNGKVEYKLDEFSENYDLIKDLFDIDKTTGAIFLKDGSRIDREKNETIQLSLTAYDRGIQTKSTSVTLKICVLDVNDNQPEFNSNLQTDFIIEENSMAFNYKITATDLDFGSNGTVFYYIETNEDNLKKFYIEPLTGLIGLTAPLDYEEKQSYELIIVSSDNGQEEQLKNTIKLRINVKDLNDNQPQFSSSLIEKTILQSIKPDETIIKLDAIDLDVSKEFHATKYAIRSVSIRQTSAQYNEDKLIDIENDLFELNSKTGVLKMAPQANLSELFYLIQVEAVDQNRPELNDRLNISLKIKQTDDEKLKPILTEKLKNTEHKIILFKRNLRENLDSTSSDPKSNYVVDIVRAEDPLKQGLNYYLDSIEEVSPQNKTLKMESLSPLFTIDRESGVIKATKPRSFYKSDTVYKLNLKITSKINETLSSNGVLQVQIDSSNDSLFDSNVYMIQIQENQLIGTKIFDLSEKQITSNKKIKFKFNKYNSLPTHLYDKWFSLDELTGVIETNSNDIDYEKYSEVLLAIDVFDEDSDLIENITCKVGINDLNDNIPTFDLTFNYEPKVNEDTEKTVQLERLLTKFSAFDLDGSDINNQIKFSIESVEPSSSYLNASSFKLEKIIELSDEKIVYGLYKQAGVNLDRDNKQIGNLVRITLKASDNGFPMLSAKKEIELTLIDINDNSPVIKNSKKLELISIFENQDTIRPFIQIEAVDQDEGANAFISYEIQSEKTRMVNNFEMRTSFIGIDKNGNLFLQANVDYERERWIDLIVNLVSSSSSNSLKTRQNIRINIMNVNDNEPKFIKLPGLIENKCQLEIDEGNWTRGAVFHKFEAADADDLNGQKFEFEIVELSTINKSGTNLNQAKILERNLFKIDSRTGQLSLSNKYELDREIIDNYKLLLSVRDEEMLGVQKETVIECFIQIMDINDNAPQFMAEQVEKNNTDIKVFPLMNEVSIINWFAATDNDLGQNSTVEYSLEVLNHNSDEFDNFFEMDSNGYLLMNAQSLTRKNSLDLNDVYMIKITASDRGIPKRLKSELVIRVKIDENYFSLSQISVDKLELEGPHSVNLNENPAPNAYVAKITVINSFVAPTNKTNRLVDLKFKLLTANETFQINERTGEITVLNVTRIDYENYKEFLLSVEAIETVNSQTGTNKTRFGTLNLMVKVINLNDNPAVFNMPSYEFSCEENQPKIPFDILVGTNNRFIQITDADLADYSMTTLPFNQLKEIRPKLNGQDAHQFRLELVKNTQFIYKLEALSSFDYERKSKYELEINVWDGQFETVVPLRVNIIDLNDNSPKFEKLKYEFNIDENSPANKFIGKINALDDDGSAKMNTVNYKILNVNIEHGPRIINSKQLQIAMINSNDDLFILNQLTGELTVGNNRNTKLLDRESILSFDLTVIAYNPTEIIFNSNGSYGEMTDMCHVIVRLNDLNDMAPEFEDIYIADIREKTPTPRPLFKLNAVDLDADLNGKVNYSIESVNGKLYTNQGINNEFHIDSDSVLNFNLYVDIDSEKTSKSFEIVIVASDAGQPSKSTRTTARVNLIDINDNKPKITEPVRDQTFEYEENNEKGMFLFQVKAFDPDYSNNRIEYTLDKDLNQDWKYFEIDSRNGKIKSLVSFDYETKRDYNLRISCTDLNGVFIDPLNSMDTSIISNDSINAYPLKLTSSIDVKLKIIDADDNEPEFQLGEPFIKNVSEILEVDSTIEFIPLALDRDFLEQNIQIRYRIISGNEENKFSLNEVTGELKLIDELERSLKNKYQLKIRATSKMLTLDEMIKENEDGLNAKSHLIVVLNIVKDKLFIEFEKNQYYVSVQQQEDVLIDQLKTTNLKQFKLNNLNNDFTRPVLNQQSVDDVRRLQDSSIFFSRSHLKQRKLKRKIRFSLAMLQLMRYNENIAIKLPDDLISTFEPESHDVINNARNTILPANSTSLFQVDSYTGKVYINRGLISKLDYQIGDQFVLTIMATAYAANSTRQINYFENTLTQLTVRLTERDYSFMMSIDNNLNNILLNYLNPLKQQYIPRLLEADGVKLAIQDLTPSKLSKQLNTTSRVDSSIYLTQSDLYDLVMQVGASSNHKQIDLDLFINMWKNFSTANVFNKDFDKFTQRQPVEEEPLINDLNKNGSLYDFSKPFYMNWIFWVLLVVGLLVIMIMGFFINCAYLTKHHKQKIKNSGLVIEYPPGYAPLYQNGFLSLANRNDISQTSSSEREYEDQELAMNIEEEEDEQEENVQQTNQ